MTLTIKLDGNWSSFQLANNTPPLSVTGSVIAPSARMDRASSQATPRPANVFEQMFLQQRSQRTHPYTETLRLAASLATFPVGQQSLTSQRSLHNAPIFRLLLKVAVKGTHQCDFLNF